MRYIKLFENENDPKAWLDLMGIDPDEYTIEEDNTISALTIRLAKKDLAILPVQFSDADSFYIQLNKLTSLKGCPEVVAYYFSCSRNLLQSLEFGPRSVGESYSYYDNPCSEDFNQVKYLPVEVMLKGKVYNMREDRGRGYFEFPQKDMDEYWEDVLSKGEPLDYKKLSDNMDMKFTNKSNDVSSKFLMHFNRGKKMDLWDFGGKVKKFEEYGQEWNQSISCPNCETVIDVSMYKPLDQFKCTNCESEFIYPHSPNWQWA